MSINPVLLCLVHGVAPMQSLFVMVPMLMLFSLLLVKTNEAPALLIAIAVDQQ